LDERDEYNNAGYVFAGRVLGCNSHDQRHHAGIRLVLIR
jgi:hypothetical protein